MQIKHLASEQSYRAIVIAFLRTTRVGELEHLTSDHVTIGADVYECSTAAFEIAMIKTEQYNVCEFETLKATHSRLRPVRMYSGRLTTKGNITPPLRVNVIRSTMRGE